MLSHGPRNLTGAINLPERALPPTAYRGSPHWGSWGQYAGYPAPGTTLLQERAHREEREDGGRKLFDIITCEEKLEFGLPFY